jgi:hypothetical protein
MKSLLLFFLSAGVLCSTSLGELSAGASVVDVTPAKLPVLVNGGMVSRSVAVVKTRVNARALVLSDGRERIALAVVDSCMMGRAFLDEAKALASAQTGIPANRILISATHAHSAPASMGCLGTDADPDYVPFLKERIVEAIILAKANMEPAQVGFGKADASAFNALRQWIRRPDRIAEDPFGNKTVRANMHAGRNWDDVTGEAGPKDPDLSLIAFRARNGRPICVLANFSMHYFGDSDISADYFGLFCEGMSRRLAPLVPPGSPRFVGIMAHGCSGDIYRVDYTIPESLRPKPAIGEYADGLLDLAEKAYAGIAFKDVADIAMEERRLVVGVRTPDRQLLEWAQRTMAGVGSRPVKTQAEIYAREQIFLAEKSEAEVVVQALRIGDIAIATTPTETYAVTGLKIKAASPTSETVVIELANGGDGYIPPPEQHAFGGYNTWPARSAGLEVHAEPKIAEAAIGLLESVTGKPRRAYALSKGSAAELILALQPAAWWRMDEFAGPHAADSGGRLRDAVYEPGITYYLEGPHSRLFCTGAEKNRAPHFVGGRMRARLPEVGGDYTVSMWIWNGLPNEARETSGWLYSRDRNHGLSAAGEHFGIAGSSGNAGRLQFALGRGAQVAAVGRTEVPRWEWHHVALLRKQGVVKAYLDGRLEIEAVVPVVPSVPPEECFFGGRSDNAANWEGRLDEIAVFSRALEPGEIARLSSP